MQKCNVACAAMLYRPGWRESLFPGVREALETMTLRGITLGIYTGTRHDAMMAQLDYHQMRDCFDPRYIRGKDNARDGGKTSQTLKIEQMRSIVAAFEKDIPVPANVIIIGDSTADARAAQDLGLFFVGFGENSMKKRQLEAMHVKHIVQDYADLPDLVTRLIMLPVNDNAAPAPRRHPKFTL